MKKIFKYSILATLLVAMTGLTSCQTEELDTDQYAGKLALAAIAPNPVMRGGQLRLIGANLDQVTEVRFAGGATVTSIEKVANGARSEIRVTVPMDGTDVGPVTVVSGDGLTASTRFDLEYTEPIVFGSFSPAEVLSGDVVTLRGEYLNNVREVILSDGVYVTAFNSQSRDELSFTVPANAVSGFVIVGDVNEIEDQNTIPNMIYSSTELVVGDPTVALADTTTYKSGDVIKISGAHLDMIEKLSLTGAQDVEFTVLDGGTSISFNLPPSASDGMMTLTSYAGKPFEAGYINTVTVADLEIASLADDGRYKAASDVVISGSDLDLVEKVEFEGAEAGFYLKDGKIYTSVPANAKDGAVTVTLASGKKAYTPAIEVVKPVITKVDKTEGVAGQDEIIIYGTDLNMIVPSDDFMAVKIGDKDHTFIKCDFRPGYDLETKESTIIAKLPKDAYTGPITVTAPSGYEAVTEEITVTYDEAVGIVFDAPSYALGKNITLKGKNLMNIEQVFIKGKKVVSFAQRADDAMGFGIPEGIGPGVYRLALTLVDGTELTWPVPFEITAPYVEKVIWSGDHDLAAWGSNLEAGPEDGFVQAGMKVGDVVRVYYTTYEDWWQIQLHDGHWGNLTLDEIDGAYELSPNNAPGGDTFFAFEVTDDVLAKLTLTGQGWGYSFVANGAGAKVKAVTLIQFGAAEQRDVIWEGSHQVHWGGDFGEDHKALTTLSWGGYDWNSVEAGTTLALEFEPFLDEVQIRVSNGSWAALPGTTDPYKLYGESKLEIELTDAMLAEMKSAGGLVLTGQGYTLKEVALVSTASVATETTVWEGDIVISDWTNYDNLGEQSLFLDAGLTEGMEVRIYLSGYENAPEDWQIKVYDGHWGGLALAEIGGQNQFDATNYSLEKGYLSFVVDAATATQLTTIDTWGSFIIIHGQGGVHVTRIAIL